jgi:hypothetical protein
MTAPAYFWLALLFARVPLVTEDSQYNPQITPITLIILNRF